MRYFSRIEYQTGLPVLDMWPWFEEGELSKTLHGVPLKEKTVCLSVDGILKPDAVLPFPIAGKMEFVREALGSHVAWPDDLVVRTMFKQVESATPNKLQRMGDLGDEGVPKQPGGVECGYYVMRYMKEIIEDETRSFPTKAVKTCKSYSQAQIDEVPIEVADYIQSLV